MLNAAQGLAGLAGMVFDDSILGPPPPPLSSSTSSSGPGWLSPVLQAATSITNSIARAVSPQGFQQFPSSYPRTQGGGVVYDPRSGQLIADPGARDIGSDLGRTAGGVVDSLSRLVQQHPVAIGVGIAAVVLWRSGRGGRR